MDKELRKERNDPHNPARLMDKRKDPDGNGTHIDPKGWTPTKWNDTGAGKGDGARSIDVPKELYDLNWDLAFGNITKAEHTAKLKELGYN